MVGTNKSNKWGNVAVSKTYRVALEGVKEGFAREFVVGELAALFKRAAEQVESDGKKISGGARTARLLMFH